MKTDGFMKGWKLAAETLAAREKEYSALDAAAGGDGDHGEAIVAALKAISSASDTEFRSLFYKIVDLLEKNVSGSTSSLYAAFFEGMCDHLDDGVSDLDPQGLADVFSAGLEELYLATNARVGDKTFMDALIPAVEALKSNAKFGISTMFDAAAKAARAGCEATAQMRAKFGRAKNLGERSIGTIDAGAASNADIWECFSKCW